jgi:hypothetical protein
VGGRRGTEEEGEQRERERVRGFGVSSWRPHLLQAATAVACIRRVDGQGIDSELFPGRRKRMERWQLDWVFVGLIAVAPGGG